MSSHQQSIGIALPVRAWSLYAEEAIASFIESARPIDKLLVSVDGAEVSLDRFAQLISQDERISLVRTPNPLSMAGHYEWCVSQLCTEWIAVLGQDDALQFNFGEESTKAIDYAARLKIDGISFRRAYFNWNDGTSEYLGYGVKYAANGYPHVIRSAYQLSWGLLGLVEHYDFPQIYTNNLVRRAAIDRLRQVQNGRVFLEPIPDTYSGVAVASLLGRYLRWPAPVFWTGTSKMSAGLEVTSTRQVPTHIVLANAEGRSFGVSQEYWVQADNSSVFILSAMLRINWSRKSRLTKSILVLITSASVFASRTVQGFRRKPLNGSSAICFTDPLSNSRMKLRSISMVAVMGLLLVPVQALVQISKTTHLTLGTLRKNGLRVLEQGVVKTPNEANQILKRNRERGI